MAEERNALMKLFMPDRAFFEPDALGYPLGLELQARFEAEGIPISMVGSHNRVTAIPGNTPQKSYRNAKRTIVVGVKRSMSLDVCKPSADFEFSLATGCPGGCQYCYLQTTMGKKPYVRIYVNVDEILETLGKYIERNLPETTTFEAASTSDPLAVEHLTGSLRRAIEYMGSKPNGLLRVVTKFDNVDRLLDARHNGHTRFRFSINAEHVIRNFEHNTSSFDERIEAAAKIFKAGYPLGFIVAPIVIFPGWKAEYIRLMDRLKEALGGRVDAPVTFELISFRFTAASKRIIKERFPNTMLDLDETTRRIKFGKFGYAKYVYKKDEAEDIRETLTKAIESRFPASRIEYFT